MIVTMLFMLLVMAALDAAAAQPFTSKIYISNDLTRLPIPPTRHSLRSTFPVTLVEEPGTGRYKSWPLI